VLVSGKRLPAGRPERIDQPGPRWWTPALRAGSHLVRRKRYVLT
jgi:hypothetical protein